MGMVAHAEDVIPTNGAQEPIIANYGSFQVTTTERPAPAYSQNILTFTGDAPSAPEQITGEGYTISSTNEVPAEDGSNALKSVTLTYKANPNTNHATKPTTKATCRVRHGILTMFGR